MIPLLFALSLAFAKKAVEPLPAAWKCSDAVADDHKAGMEALLASDWAKAETSFAAVLVKEPNCGLSLTGSGRAKVMLAKYAEAEEPLKKASGLFADQVDPLLWLAKAQVEGGKMDEALATANAAIAIKPGSVDAHRVVQRVLLSKNDLAGAHAMMVTARGVSSNSAWECFDGIVFSREGELGKAQGMAEVCKNVPDASIYAEFTKEMMAAVARMEAAQPPEPEPVPAAPAATAAKGKK